MAEVSTFEGNILRRTQRGVLFIGNYWEAPLWFPISQMAIDQDIDSLESVVKIKSWLCRKRGINEFTHYSEEEIQKIAET